MRGFCTLLLLLFSWQLYSQAEKVAGLWLTQDGDSQVKISKAADSKFYGQIVWLKNPTENGKPKLDKHNPNAGLKSRPLMNLQLLAGFKYDSDDKEWVDGSIYDPKSGKTYRCYMWLDDDNVNLLHVKGFIGFSWIGREVEWRRETIQRK